MSLPTRETKKILVIDDTPTMRLIVTGMLEDLGFTQIAQAESADMGWDLIRSGKFDLILCDWNMPGKSGLELLRMIRSNSETAKFPLIMMTSNNDPVQIAEARAAGVSNYLVKPFGAMDLSERMNEAFLAHS